jgi:ribonuclease J
MIEIYPIGGYSKVEGNSVLIKVDDESVILDMGLTMDNYVQFQNKVSKFDKNSRRKFFYNELLEVDAVPDYYSLGKLIKTVKAVVPSHAHLDHVGAVPYGMKFFHNVPVLGTPYTIEFLKKELESTRHKKYFVDNKISLITCKLNSTYKLSEKISIEFIEVTHSVPDSAIVVVHTPYGSVMYAVDYKFDLNPQLGNPPNFKRLEELGKEGVKCLILESLYADFDIETASEEDVKQELIETINNLDLTGKTIIASTFSSHIIRLKTLIDIGKSLNRKVCLVGRSLKTHSDIAQRVKVVNLKKEVELVSLYDDINELLENIYTNREDYFLICTGHQGEEFSVLTRILDGWFDFSFSPEDIMIFSSSVIPTQVNQESFSVLEEKMEENKLQIIKDIHASGHAGLKDHKKMLEMVNPETIIPAHAGHDKAIHIKNLSDNINIGKTILTQNGDYIKVI